GVDLGQFPYLPRHAPPPGEAIRLVLAGRFIRRKGVLTLLDAFARAHARDPRLHLTLLGDGPLRPILERLVAAHGLGGSVRLPGFVPPGEVRATLARSHLLVLPSEVGPNGETEGTPTAIIEAMASGL